MGALDLLPAQSAKRLKMADRDTADINGMMVNIAVSYGGRHELRDAVRSLLAEHAKNGTSIDELAQTLDIEHIAEHLYTKGQPDPDLIIRTSGEQRLSGFLMWQSAHSEFYFCEALWPDFRKVDFIRALRSVWAAGASLRALVRCPASRETRSSSTSIATSARDLAFWTLGDDTALLDVITSANLACGFHAGDPNIMRRVCEAAVSRGVAIGAQVELSGTGRLRSPKHRHRCGELDQRRDLSARSVGWLRACRGFAGALCQAARRPLQPDRAGR